MPTVRLGKAEIRGVMDREVLRRVVRARLGEVSRCYHEGLARDDRLMGRVVVGFRVDAIGRVLAPTVAESTLSDEEVGVCVVAAMKAWEFPPDGDGVVEVRYPFVFDPG